MTNRSNIHKEIEIPPRKPKAPKKKKDKKKSWRDVPFDEWLDTIPVQRKRGGKIMVGYKAGGKV